MAQALSPKEIKASMVINVNDAGLETLTETYKRAYTKIVKELTHSKGFSLANRKQMLKNVDKILVDLGVDVDKFIEKEIPAQYKTGAQAMVKQGYSQGADMEVKSGFNTIHKQAIEALVVDTQTSFHEALTGIKRSVSNMLGKGVRDQLTGQLAESMTTGQALRQAKRNMVGLLQENGLASLVDKGGKEWELDTYAEMLIRTKSVDARNQGLGNRMVENGYDLVLVTSTGTDHEECKYWEGKILSLTGATKGFPTVADAEKAGLFHPNCQHAINVIVPELQEEMVAEQKGKYT